MAPRGWTRVQLGDVFAEVVDKKIEERLPVLAVTLDRGVVRRNSLDRKMDREVEQDAYLRALPGDIAYNTMRMWQGGSGLVREAGFISPAYTILRPKGEECSEFWAHAFKAPEMIESFRCFSQGVAKDRLRLYYDQFAAVPALRPPLPEQRKIAAILSSVDETIEKTEAVIERLDVVKKAMLEELLTRGMPGRHSRFKETEIGVVPEGWEVRTLGELGAIQTGLAKNKNSVVDGGSELPYLSVANVQDGALDLSTLKVAKVDAAGVDRYRLRPGDVLFCEGGDADKVGRGTIWRGEVPGCLHQNHVFVFRPNRARVLPEFVSAYRSSARGRRYFMDCAKQTTNLASINSSQLRSMPLVVPTLEEQTEMVEVMSTVVFRLGAEKVALNQARALKASLAGALLSGSIRVSRP